jgi:hypothetical protein
MYGWFLLLVCVLTTNAQEVVTFGTGLSSNRLYLAEVIINNFWVTGAAGMFHIFFIFYGCL